MAESPVTILPSTGRKREQRYEVGALVGLAVLLAVVAAGCGGELEQGDGTSGLGVLGIHYRGSGSPQFIVASDLPLQGSSRAQTIEMTKAIAYMFKQAGYKAGKYTVGYQSCDDSTAQAGKWAPAKCSANAGNYARDKSRDRRHRHLQLGLCRDRGPDREPCAACR